MLEARRRKAALNGTVLPHELLARLAKEPEPGSAPAQATDEQRAAADEGPRYDRPAADLSSADSKAAQQGAGGAGEPAPARLAAEVSTDGNSLSRGSAAMAGVAAAVAAQQVAMQVAVQPTSVAGAKVSGAEQVAGAPAEPLPAYTSLARQQLQQRLKAAIAAGTRPAGKGAAGAHTARPTAQPPRGGCKTGSQHAQQTQAPRLLHSPRLSLGPPGSCPAATLSGQQQVLAGLGIADTLPVPSAASLEDGFQLRLPGSTSGGSTAGLEQRSQPACPAQASAGASQQHLPAKEASSAQPHWLGGHLLRQHLYMAAPKQPGHLLRQHAQQGRQRGLLALRMPPLTAQFAELLPVRAGDSAGTPCLLVLPSEGPSSRHEAEAALAALAALLADPAAAAERAAAWRQQLLLSSSAAALLGLTADYAPFQHQQQLRREHSGQPGAGGGLLAGPAWLAASSDTGAGLARAPSGKLDNALEGVRSSSGFLRPSSHGSMGSSASPLPPLVPPPTSSRLCFAPPGAGRAGRQDKSRAQAAEHSSMALHSTGCVLCLGSSPSPGAALAAMSAQDAAAPLPVPPPPPTSDPAWDGYCCASLAAGLAACMAEAVRQVEVGCAERGRLLAQLWNSYTGVLAATIQQQQAQVQALAAANANLAAETMQLRWEVSSMGFLRTEIGRLRIDKETVALELEDCRRGMAALREAREEADKERQALEAHLARRVAVLRWRHAGAAVLALDRRSSGHVHRQQSGSSNATEEPASILLRQAAELERLAGATVEAQHQQRERRHGKRAEAALAAALSAPAGPAGGGATPRTRHTSRLQHGSSAELDKPPHQRQVLWLGAAASGSGAGSNWATAGSNRGDDGGFAVGSALGALRCMQPEARAVLLLSQPAEQRRQLLAAMTDGDRAGLAVLLDEPARLQLHDELGSALALSTDAFIDRKPLLLAKLLATLPPEQAAARFESKLAPQQQVVVLQAVPRQQAAELLAAQPEAARQGLVLGMLPGAAAGLLHWLMPAAALQLLLGGCSGPAGAAPAAAGPEAGSGSSWVTEVLQRLDERHLAAMLAAAKPGDVATLLEIISGGPRQRLLGLMPQKAKAAALT